MKKIIKVNQLKKKMENKINFELELTNNFLFPGKN